MNKTKIEWADSTWNPVTGCLHECEYCYARRIASRFGGYDEAECCPSPGAELNHQLTITRKNGKKVAAPFPFGFLPTFHRYRLGELQHKNKPQTIFVCSMADLFGEWIYDVFNACNRFSQHRYLFLTKNPRRYIKLEENGWLPDEKNFWYGTTVTNPEQEFFYSSARNTFLSMEPLLKPFGDAGHFDGYPPKWIIIGAMTGSGSKQHQPKQDWINEILEAARKLKFHVFMKDSLIPIVGKENMICDFPWEVHKNG